MSSKASPQESLSTSTSDCLRSLWSGASQQQGFTAIKRTDHAHLDDKQSTFALALKHCTAVVAVAIVAFRAAERTTDEVNLTSSSDTRPWFSPSS